MYFKFAAVGINPFFCFILRSPASSLCMQTVVCIHSKHFFFASFSTCCIVLFICSWFMMITSCSRSFSLVYTHVSYAILISIYRPNSDNHNGMYHFWLYHVGRENVRENHYPVSDRITHSPHRSANRRLAHLARYWSVNYKYRRLVASRSVIIDSR